MNIPTLPNGGFFPTPDQRKLILVAIDHLMDGGCNCVDEKMIVAGFEVIDLLKAIENLSHPELQDMADSWNEPGVEE